MFGPILQQKRPCCYHLPPIFRRACVCLTLYQRYLPRFTKLPNSKPWAWSVCEKYPNMATCFHFNGKE